MQTLTDRQVHALAGEVYSAFRARQPAEDRTFPAEMQPSFLRWSWEIALGEEPYPPGHANESLPPWRRAEIIVGADALSVLGRHGIAVDHYTHQRFMVASARAMLLAIKQTLRESQGVAMVRAFLAKGR